MSSPASQENGAWLGLDLGTQSVRAVLASGDGRVVGRGAQPLAAKRDGTRHEQDPRGWWRATAGACREALRDFPPGAVRGVAADATSGTVLLMDDAGGALTPGLMYDDSRAAAQTPRVNEAGVEVWGALGYRMQPAWGLPKVLWMIEEWPELVAGSRLAHQSDYIVRRLAGHDVPTDSSHALKSGYDLLHDDWPHDVLDRLGIPESLLPDVVRSGSRLGRVCEEASRETGIPAGTPVIAGMTDSCAAQLASATLEEGSWNSVLGTTLALKGASAELIRDPNGTLYCHRAPDGGWLPGGASSTGAGVLSSRFPGRDLDDLGDQAAEHEATCVIAYPLESPGERFPFEASEARGFMLGRPEDDAEHFAALLQGMAFVERLCFDYVDMLGARTHGRLTLTGGASRGHYLSQLRADVLGRPVTRLEDAGSAVGMAILAAAEGRSVTDTAAEMVRVREIVDPRPGRTERFFEPYARLLAELEQRGWLPSPVAGHARARMTA